MNKKLIWPISGGYRHGHLHHGSGGSDRQPHRRAGMGSRGPRCADGVQRLGNGEPAAVREDEDVRRCCNRGGRCSPLIVGGVSTQEWVNLIVLALAALGVAVTPQPITTVVNGTTVPANGEIPGTNKIVA